MRKVVYGLFAVVLFAGCAEESFSKSEKEVVIVRGVANEGECTEGLIDSNLLLLIGKIESVKYYPDLVTCDAYSEYKECTKVGRGGGSCVGIIAPERI
ncbi:hypothetical protein [Sulfurovum sp.]|uniref:hypothetical protein n=1 Tax=Sulfurovum sp. TaxID=1969726 RepID=UPI002A35E86E|nr:hypothetical protein [Sulfurovum sp.]MDD2450310.1 hypothetical protein [Sulfurovum sp.]MDY0401891.1 hypothetical protein [Sulfurovum sp.]